MTTCPSPSLFRLFLTTFFLVFFWTDSKAELVQLSNFTNGNSYVRDFEFSPGVGRVIFSEDVNESGTFDSDIRNLFSAIPNEPASLVRLNNLVNSQAERIVDWKVSPNGARVIMRGDLIGNGLRQLFTASTTQPGTQLRVDTNTQFGDNYSVRDYSITPDSSRVVFLALINGASRLLSAPISGGAAINLSPVSGSDVTDFVLLENSQQVIYRSDIENGTFELYLASTSQAGTSQKVTDLASDVAEVDGDLFAVSPNGSSVVYSVNLILQDRAQLLRRPINPTGSRTAISAPGVTNSFIRSLLAPEDSGRVQFTADLDQVGVNKVYAKIDSLPEAFIISDHSANPTGSVAAESLTRTPDNARVLYTGNLTTGISTDLYSSLVGSAGTQVRISQPTNPFSTITQFEITPGSDRVVYSGELDASGGIGLFSAPVSGSGPQTKLFTRSAGQTFLNWALAPDGSRVIFTVISTIPSLALDVFSVPVDGSSAAENVADVTTLGSSALTRVGFTPTNVPLIGGNQMLSVQTITPPGPTPPPTPVIDNPRLNIRGKKRIKTRKARVVLRGQARGEELARVEVRYRNKKRKFVTRRIRVRPNGAWKFAFRAKTKRSILQFRAINDQGGRSKQIKVRIIRVRR